MKTRMNEHRDLKSKDWTMHGVKHDGERAVGHHADVVAGVSIRLHGTETNRMNGPLDYDKTFRIGDQAVYDSYNLYYFGEITKIGKATVTITAHGGNRRLDLHTFSRRNSDAAERKLENNRTWMD